jgi:hypothetical protein
VEARPLAVAISSVVMNKPRCFLRGLADLRRSLSTGYE